MSQLMDHPIERTGLRLSRRLQLGLGFGAAAIVVAAVATLFVSNSKSTFRASAENLTTAVAEIGVFHDTVALRATVVPQNTIFLATLEGGQVVDVMAQSGDVVIAGQPLVKFQNTELELEVLDREGRLAESITQLQTFEKQLEDARVANERGAAQIDYDILRLGRDAKRYDTLIERGFIPRQQYEATHDELEHDQRLRPLQAALNDREEQLRRKQLPQLQAELSSLQESLKVARAKLDSLTLRAPVAGTLADMHLNIGEIHNRGERLGQVIPNAGFKVEAHVDEYYLDRVRIGQAGAVDVDGRTYPIRVTRVDPQVKDATFRIELAFQGAQPKGVSPGQALDGRLTLGSDKPGLLLPVGPFLERTGGAWVMVVAPDGNHADRRKVRVGRRTTDQVEVLSGLRPGERVITSDYTGFEKVDRIVISR